MKAVLSLANAMWMTMMNSHQNMASETFLRFSLSKDGNVIDKNVGAAPKSDFVEKVEALLK